MDVAMTRYCTHDVAVPGGALRVGVWDAPAGAPTALLVHGVTSSHLAWGLVAERLPGVRLIAPDLRGRGRSHPEGAAGMAAHADDLSAVLAHFDVASSLVVGHSMGAFVAVVAADRHPERVPRLLLVDGGLPLAVPEELSADEVIRHVLGPTAARLAMRFASVEDYHAFWRQHPAFARDWSAFVEDYFAYDLVGDAPELRPATSYDVMAEDTVDLNSGTALAGALAQLSRPARLLVAPRGLLDETPGLYAAERLEGMLASLPGVTAERVDDVNHYTITMGPRGAAAVAEAIREELAVAVS